MDFSLQITFLCEIKRTFNVNKILNVHEKYKAIEIYVKTTCVRNNYGLNTKKQNTEGTIRLIYIPLEYVMKIFNLLILDNIEIQCDVFNQ